MTTTIKIGADQDTFHTAKPLNHLPAKLDLDTCIGLLARADCFLTEDGIKAGKQLVTLDSVDDVLELSSLSIDDKIRFKHALAAHGIIMAGKRA